MRPHFATGILVACMLLGTLAGCGAPAAAGPGRAALGTTFQAAGALVARQPTLEAAFPVALAVAAKALDGRKFTSRVAGKGVDAAGRLLSDDELRSRHPGASGSAAFTFTFTFARDAQTIADAEVVIDAAGQAFLRATAPRARDLWQPEPAWRTGAGTLSLAAGLARAMADCKAQHSGAVVAAIW